jgi:pyruvate formate lyase activating enzyme
VGSGRSDGVVRASLWRDWRGGPSVHCFLCAHHCRIVPGERGRCGVRENRDGVLCTLVYGRPISLGVDPIEKKPLFHFLPGTRSLSLATVGCNFACSFCQNSEISQMPGQPPEPTSGHSPEDHRGIPGRTVSPRQVVEAALEQGCQSISYTYTEPTVFYEYARDCAQLADVEGLKNVFVTNGYMTADTLRDIDGLLHAANVDLKSFSDEFYRTLVGARLKPVLDSIRRLWQMGVWVEVTTLLIPGLNDGEDELRSLASFLASISCDIPWHVSRFFPAYRLLDVAPTPTASIEKAASIGREEGLRYVYGGNIPGHSSESTLCPGCGGAVIERQGFRMLNNGVIDGRCPHCGREIPVYQKEARA